MLTKCFVTLTLMFPIVGESPQKDIQLDMVGSITDVFQVYDENQKKSLPNRGSYLGIPGRGFVYVRETREEIRKKPCIRFGDGQAPARVAD